MFYFVSIALKFDISVYEYYVFYVIIAVYNLNLKFSYAKFRHIKEATI